MPKDSIYNKQKKGLNYIKVGISFILLSLVAWFMPDFSSESYSYKDMHEDDLILSPAIQISGIEYLSENVKDKKIELADVMKTKCSDDVLFAFQFVHLESNMTVEDHIFMLCSKNKVYANAEIVKSSESFILCTEQYASVVQKKKRPSSVRIKAIDVDVWDIVEYESENNKESCIIQHALDVLNSKWV
jgi:hypothetical protein